MKFTPIILLSLAHNAFAALAGRAVCNADNCARAVTGTRRGPEHVSSARADCSSFMAATVVVYPNTTATYTDVVTATITITPSFQLARRQATTTFEGNATTRSLPAYASPCNGDYSRYASACSCWGINATTVTSSAPSSVTVTEYTTITEVASVNSTSTTSSSTSLNSTSSTSESTTPTPTTTVCPPFQTECSGECVDTLVDETNCGVCGNVCSSGTCTNGVCASAACEASSCGNFSFCASGAPCICASTADSTGFCIDGNTSCGVLSDCATSADCAEGQVCAVNSCCARNVCIGSGGCDNDSAPPRIFAKRSRAGTVGGFGMI